MVNLYNMVCMKLNSHPTANLFGAKWVIVKDANIKLRSDFCNSNPHPLDMRLIAKLYPKNQLGKVARLQALAALLRRNLKCVRKLSVSRCAVIKTVSNRHRVMWPNRLLKNVHVI